MACRDYEFDYDRWMQRSQQRLAELTAMLRDVCNAARRGRVEIPHPVIEGMKALEVDREIGKEKFDTVVRLLCTMCGLVSERDLPLPVTAQTWWQDHRLRDENEELAKGLSPTPIYADFWQEHAAKQDRHAELSGVARQDAVDALLAAGCRIVQKGKLMTMEKEDVRFFIPKGDPVNSFAMAEILRRVGLTVDQFRELLHRVGSKRAKELS